jgi:hypothetical protein
MLRVLQMLLLLECWRAGCCCWWCRTVFGEVRVPVRRQQRNARWRGCRRAGVLKCWWRRWRRNARWLTNRNSSLQIE